MVDEEAPLTIRKLYVKLFEMYGPQGWWPVLDENGNQFYHKGDYSYPKTRKQQFEIIIGAILTQNTSWKQVDKSLHALHSLGALEAEKLLLLSDSTLKEAIRYAGYYNQKADRLQRVARWFFQRDENIPRREELMEMKGIGPETADSILLYAFHQPSFIIDSYTKRVMSGLGFCEEKVKYDRLKELFEDNLEKDVILFQEYHALIVEHAKRYYTTTSKEDDPLTTIESHG
ncbi:MAG: endonuclease III domain-containing protein [Candidatus Woesearchaeota archaeon]